MSGGVKKLIDFDKKLYGGLIDPAGIFSKVDGPKIKKPPTIDAKEANRRADLVRRVRRQRAVAAQGFSDTRRTGPRGLGQGSGVPANRRALLGA